MRIGMMRRSNGARCASVALFVLVTACVSAKPRPPASEGAARLRPPETPLSEFGTFELKPLATATIVSVDPAKAAIANALGTKLDAKLKPLFADWAAKASATNQERGLVVQPVVTDLRISQSTSFRQYKGDSYIDLQLTLFDKKANRAIAANAIHVSVDANDSALTFGKYDAALPEEVVEIVNQYLVNSYTR
jgi:hypothetical protein